MLTIAVEGAAAEITQNTTNKSAIALRPETTQQQAVIFMQVCCWSNGDLLMVDEPEAAIALRGSAVRVARRAALLIILRMVSG